MNVNLNTQYAVLRSSANDVNRSLKARSESVAQLASGPQSANAVASGTKETSLLVLRNGGLRLRALESGITNAMSFLEAQADVFRNMTRIVSRMSELGSQMSDATKTPEDMDNYMKEFLSLQEEMSGYRTLQFNGKNLMNYVDAQTDGNGNEISPREEAESLSVLVSEDGNSALSITQSDLVDGSGPLLFTTLLGKITAATRPFSDGNGIATMKELTSNEPTETSDGWGQQGFTALLEDIANRMANNEAEQAQLRMNLDKVREKILGTESAVSRVSDVDVAGELSVLARTDMQLRGSIAAKTQSNVFADSALKLLSNGDFSTPLIQEARLSAPWTKAMVG